MDHASKDLPLLSKRYLEKQSLYILPCLENLKIYIYSIQTDRFNYISAKATLLRQ